jgi:hypothetical protein
MATMKNKTIKTDDGLFAENVIKTMRQMPKATREYHLPTIAELMDRQAAWERREGRRSNWTGD